MQIGPYTLDGKALLAPMAGVSDEPFRALCREFGAALTTSEMVTSDARLWNSRKSEQRLSFGTQDQPLSVQIVGYDPGMMANAAQQCVAIGAEIIDINMGCPAKKVCSKAAGSALLRDEALVTQIVTAVVNAVEVPVTLKIRTGWCPDTRNAVRIAQIAESAGIQALAVHGRTRACRFKGAAEYETIRSVKAQVKIPVIANGDINSPKQAQFVLDYTQADAIMIGRAAQGAPWIFRDINALVNHQAGEPMTITMSQKIIARHLRDIHKFYGETIGVRIARKHVAWYSNHFLGGESFRRRFMQLESANAQLEYLQEFFASLDGHMPLAA